MQSPTEALPEIERRGYTENLVPRYDHLELHDGKVRLYPPDFELDDAIRFEYTSDPDDQCILYLISFAQGRGTFLESYGLYHEEMSVALLHKLMQHRNAA